MEFVLQSVNAWGRWCKCSTAESLLGAFPLRGRARSQVQVQILPGPSDSRDSVVLDPFGNAFQASPQGGTLLASIRQLFASVRYSCIERLSMFIRRPETYALKKTVVPEKKLWCISPSEKI
jgi:hypothetical protein